MATPQRHWQEASRSERLVRILLTSFAPVRFPTVAIVAFFAASNYAKACVVARGMLARNEAELYQRLSGTPELSSSGVLLPYVFLRYSFEDAFYLEDGAPWTEQSALSILAELERLRSALMPRRGFE